MTDKLGGDGTDRRLTRDYWREPISIPETLPPLTNDIDDAQFRLLADSLPTLCWMARGDGYIVWYNRRWHQYCGTTPASMEGWGWQSVHDPLELPRVLAGWQGSVASGEPFEMVFPLRGADGRFRPFLTRIVPVRDANGTVVRWFGVNTDITAQVQAEASRDATKAQYDVLTEAMPQMVWSTLSDGFHDYYNQQWYDFTGVPEGSTDGEGWNDMFHPEDQERAWAQWRHCLATGAPYEIEYRLRHRSGDYRWTLGRARPVRDPAGRIVRWIGTCTDIHEAKLAHARSETLSSELSHRIKNIFAIVTGLIRLSARRDPSVATFARDLTQRIAALGRAHDYARPHSEKSRPDTSEMMLHGLLATLFHPYAEAGNPRILVAGDDLPLDDKGATPIALLFHELATNAAKYGALSVADGQVAVQTTRAGDTVTLVWEETGGPAIAAPPTQEGFGTKLAAMSVDQQLSGKLEREWRVAGLWVRVVIPAAGLIRSSPVS